MKIPASTSRLALVLSLLVAGSCAGPEGADDGGDEAALLERARGIHERVITLDTHVDISPANFTAERNYTADLPGTQVDLPSMEEGGLDVAWLVVYVGQGELTEEGYARAHQQALEKFAAIHRLAEEIAPDRIGLATTSDEVREIVASGRKVAMIGIENAYQVGTDLSNIELFHDLGGRYMSLSHNGHSQFSDSNTGERDGEWLHGGLSDLGRQAVAEMNRLGMMIDISHPSKAASMEIFELSRAPVIASHSASRAMYDHSRNLDDEQLRALQANGGVVQTVAFRGYVDGDKEDARDAAVEAIEDRIAQETGFEPLGRGEVRDLPEAEREAYRQELDAFQARVDQAVEAEGDAIPEGVDVADFVDHIDYIVDLVGIDHVGISPDFDGGGGVEGWDDASETFNVTLELVRRGYTEEEIAQLWSGNLLRVLDEVQAVA
ncbi:MAG TPA: dipeptidase, partial [Longimicrobiales bacterium]|nr:dipeptidase [Longimicrobiales bacterium]